MVRPAVMADRPGRRSCGARVEGQPGETSLTSNSDFRIRIIFVQIKCRPGAAYQVAARIMDTVPGTAEIYSTSGSFDLLAKFQLEPGMDPGLFVTSVVQRVEGIADTYTIMGFNAFTPGANPA